MLPIVREPSRSSLVDSHSIRSSSAILYIPQFIEVDPSDSTYFGSFEPQNKFPKTMMICEGLKQVNFTITLGESLIIQHCSIYSVKAAVTNECSTTITLLDCGRVRGVAALIRHQSRDCVSEVKFNVVQVITINFPSTRFT